NKPNIRCDLTYSYSHCYRHVDCYSYSDSDCYSYAYPLRRTNRWERAVAASPARESSGREWSNIDGANLRKPRRRKVGRTVSIVSAAVVSLQLLNLFTFLSLAQ